MRLRILPERPTLLMAALLGLVGTVPLSARAQDGPPTLAERLGYAADARLLIVHADDIGVSHSVNRASIDALATGLVNSGSIMVPCPWFPEIAAHAREYPDLDLGLHLTLTSEWELYRWPGVLPDAPGLHDDQGFLYPDVESVVRNATAEEVEREIRAQVDRALAFRVRPTHLDSHMGTLFRPKFLEAYLRVGRDYKLPLLLPRTMAGQPQVQALLTPDDILIDRVEIATPSVAPEAWDAFYSGIVEGLRPGVTEIIIHLAYDDAEMQAVTVNKPDYGSAWRQRDFDYFTGDRFAALLEEHGVHLVTWREIGRLIQ